MPEHGGPGRVSDREELWPADGKGKSCLCLPGWPRILNSLLQLARLDLLTLDELGDVPTGKLGAELLFDMISVAYERNSVIVTANLPFEQ